MSTVKPYGRLDAHYIIVGEAPGVEEVRKKELFVGRSGQLLNSLLLSVGIARSDCYMTNVVKERPPENYIGKFLKFNNKGQAIETDEFKAYVKQLGEELQQTTSHVVLALGKTALYALTGKRLITKERGSLLKPRPELNLGNKVILACIHPSAALRQYIFTVHMKLDLMKLIAVRRINPDNINIDQKILHDKIITNPSTSVALAWLEKYSLMSKKNNIPLAFDIEVINLETASVGFSYWSKEEKSAICIAFKEYQELYAPDTELQIIRKITSVLEDQHIEKLGQNLAFDIDFLFRKYGIRTQNFQDTMIAQALLSPDLPKGLDYICSIYTDIPYYKDEGKMWKGGGGDYNQFWLYNGKDCIACSIAWPKLKADMMKFGIYKTYQRQRDIILPMVWAQNRGIRMDLENIKQAYKDAGIKIIELEQHLNEVAGQPLNANSPKQLKNYFYVEKGYPPYMSQGKMTTNELAMKRLARKGEPAAQIILDIRKTKKLKSTYLEPSKIDLDGRLRTSYKPVGTLNGRMSSTETIFGTGMNLQNLPKAMKKFLLFDENYIGYELDLSQAENRLVGYLSNEFSMIHAFENNIDIHSQTGAMVYQRVTGSKITWQEIRAMHKDGLLSTLGNGSRSWRYWGKQANHGLNYDEGYKTFSLRNEIPEKDGKVIYNTYHNTYPEIHNWHKRIVGQLHRNRTLTNPFGRKRRFLDRWGDQMFKQAYNFVPQSTVADIINERGITYVWTNFPEYVELINQVHDSIVFQIPVSVPFEKHAEIIKQIAANLERPVKIPTRSFVIPADLQVGFNFKDMEEVNIGDNLDKTIRRIWDDKNKGN